MSTDKTLRTGKSTLPLCDSEKIEMYDPNQTSLCILVLGCNLHLAENRIYLFVLGCLKGL